jgi:hypothetical protein
MLAGAAKADSVRDGSCFSLLASTATEWNGPPLNPPVLLGYNA